MKHMYHLAFDGMAMNTPEMNAILQFLEDHHPTTALGDVAAAERQLADVCRQQVKSIPDRPDPVQRSMLTKSGLAESDQITGSILSNSTPNREAVRHIVDALRDYRFDDAWWSACVLRRLIGFFCRSSSWGVK
ncbi:MAG TPA: hypothetical protein VIJ79_17345 [Acidobacteriaceae bacterium]